MTRAFDGSELASFQAFEPADVFHVALLLLVGSLAGRDGLIERSLALGIDLLGHLRSGGGELFEFGAPDFLLCGFG